MALREINLVPSEIIMHRCRKRHLWLWAVSLIVILVSIGGTHVYQTQTLQAPDILFLSAQDVDKQIISKIGEINQIQKEVETLQQQQSEFEQVLLYPSYSALLYHLSNTMNANTWIKTLEIKTDNSPEMSATLQITGYALSNGALGNFLNQMSDHPKFENVKLKYAKETVSGKYASTTPKRDQRVEFEVACTSAEG